MGLHLRMVSMVVLALVACKGGGAGDKGGGDKGGGDKGGGDKGGVDKGAGTVGDGPSCAEVVKNTHGLSLTAEEAAKMEQTCRDQPERYTASVRRCLAGAKELEDARECLGRPRVGKISEGELSLAGIRRANASRFAERQEFVAASAQLTPATPCCAAPDHRCPVVASDWLVPAWEQLDFEMTKAHYFQYAYEGASDHFTATAVGDPECDGTSTTYRLIGTIKDGQPDFRQEPPRGD